MMEDPPKSDSFGRVMAISFTIFLVGSLVGLGLCGLGQKFTNVGAILFFTSLAGILISALIFVVALGAGLFRRKS